MHNLRTQVVFFASKGRGTGLETSGRQGQSQLPEQKDYHIVAGDGRTIKRP